MVTTRTLGLELLVIQPTALCNLDCRYCYVPDRLNARRLPISLLEKLLHTLRRSKIVSAQTNLNILWHAGEPLAAGIDYFGETFSTTERVLGDRWRIRHSIQTNGTLITPDWCTLLKANRVTIGVSIDGPKELHDANRRRLGGGGSFVQGMRGLELLRARSIPVNILTVLTSSNINQPEQMFYFFLGNALRDIAFNVEEIEGPNVHSSLQTGSGSFEDAKAHYRLFMTRFAELNKLHGWPLRIREFRNLGHLIEKRRECETYYPPVPEQVLGAILTMSRDGEIYSWSPELASGIPGSADRFCLGRIQDVESIDELLLAERAQLIQNEIDEGVEMCRQRCEYFGVCGGGSPANKFYEQGTFATTETLKCALQTKELVNVIVNTFTNRQHTANATSTMMQSNVFPRF